MIAHYLKVAFRNLWKYKTQHIVSVFCLAIGVLAFSLMIRFVSVMSERADYIGGERAMQLNISKKDFAGDIPFYEEDVRRLENQVTGMLDSISAFSYEANMDVEVVGIDGNETPYQVTYKVANSSAFLFWKLPLLYGSRLPEEEDEIIVSASFARKIAGGDNPVGRVVGLHRRPLPMVLRIIGL